MHAACPLAIYIISIMVQEEKMDSMESKELGERYSIYFSSSKFKKNNNAVQPHMWDRTQDATGYLLAIILENIMQSNLS